MAWGASIMVVSPNERHATVVIGPMEKTVAFLSSDSICSVEPSMSARLRTVEGEVKTAACKGVVASIRFVSAGISGGGTVW